VAAHAFEPGSVPEPPPAVPGDAALHAALLEGHPELARLRAAYAVAEKELRLEIARQYPALAIGPTYEREDADKWGLALGIEVPLFDRNQPGIARAEAVRDEVRERFAAEVARRLAAIEAARARLLWRTERVALLRTKVLPNAEEALALARRTLESGAADALRFLAVLREQEHVRIEVVEAERDLLAAWSDLEEACGVPLLDFAEDER
jgi:CRISPR system Cascade subunit CasA